LGYPPDGGLFSACSKLVLPGRIFKLTDLLMKIMYASKTIECVYEGGVFRPLEKVELQEGTKLRIKVGRCDISRYYGILGKASVERLAELEDEAQF
jgi:predicted DNA-binding antitoxin AbrB/MazE fold protein